MDTPTWSGPPRRAMPQSLRPPRLTPSQMLSTRCLPPARLGSMLSMPRELAVYNLLYAIMALHIGTFTSSLGQSVCGCLAFSHLVM